MRVGMRIGEPLDFSRYEGMEDDRFVLRSITDEIMYELMQLSGQEYVDMYATSMKDRLVAAARAKARELQEAAKPGSAAKELEEALDAAEGRARRLDGRGLRVVTEHRRPRPSDQDDDDGDAPVVAASDDMTVPATTSAVLGDEHAIVRGLWRGIDVFRWLALVYAAWSAWRRHGQIAHLALGVAVLGVLAAWTLTVTLRPMRTVRACTIELVIGCSAIFRHPPRR